MSTTLFSNSKQPINISSETEVGYNPPSALGLVISFMLIMVAFFGLVWPTFFSLNLSWMHCLVLGGAGVVSAIAALSRNKRLTIRIYYGLALFFFLNAALGWLFGDPGSPRFAFYSEQQLEKVAPGFLELAITDHIVHFMIALAFLAEAFAWKEFLLGHEVHVAQMKAFRKIARFVVVPIILAAIMLMVDQVQKSPSFSANCDTCEGRAAED